MTLLLFFTDLVWHAWYRGPGGKYSLMNHFDTAVNALASVLSARAARSTLEDGLANLGKTQATASLEDYRDVLRGQIYKRLQVVMPVNAAGKLIQEIEYQLEGENAKTESAPKSVVVVSSEPYKANDTSVELIAEETTAPTPSVAASVPKNPTESKRVDDTRATLIFDPELLVNSKTVSANLRAISAVSLEFGDVLYAVPELKQELRGLRRRAESGDQIHQPEFDVLSQRLRDQRRLLSDTQLRRLSHYEIQLEQLEGLGKRSAEMDLRFESAKRMLESGMLATADIKQLEEKLRDVSPALVLEADAEIAPNVSTDQPFVVSDPKSSVELAPELVNFESNDSEKSSAPTLALEPTPEVHQEPVGQKENTFSTEEPITAIPPQETEPSHGSFFDAENKFHDALESSLDDDMDKKRLDELLAQTRSELREEPSTESVFVSTAQEIVDSPDEETGQPEMVESAIAVSVAVAEILPEPITEIVQHEPDTQHAGVQHVHDAGVQHVHDAETQHEHALHEPIAETHQHVEATATPKEEIIETVSQQPEPTPTIHEQPSALHEMAASDTLHESTTSGTLHETLIPGNTQEPEDTHIPRTISLPEPTPPPVHYEPLFPSNNSSTLTSSTSIATNNNANPYGDWSRDRFLKSTPINEVRMNMSQNDQENETPTNTRSSAESISRISGNEEAAILLARSRRDAASRNAERMRSDPMSLKPDQMQAEQNLVETEAALVASRLEAKLQTVQATHAKLESGLGMRVAQAAADLAHKSMEAVRLRDQYGAVTGAGMEHARLEQERAQEDLSAARMFEKVTAQTSDTNEPNMPSVRLDHEQLQGQIAQTPRMLAARHALERAELNLAIKDNPYSPAVDVSAAKELVEMAGERLSTLQNSMRADLEASLAEIRFTHAESVRHEQTWRRSAEELRTSEERLAAGQISVLARDEAHLRAVRAEHDYRTSVHRHIEAIHRLQVLTNSDLQNA